MPNSNCHVVDNEACECEDCAACRPVVIVGRKGRRTKQKTAASKGSELEVMAFGAAKSTMGAAMNDIYQLLYCSVWPAFRKTDECKSFLGEDVPDHLVLPAASFVPFLTAVPKNKNNWGSWDKQTHLEVYKPGSEYATFFQFCKSQEAATSELLFYTACLELESLEDCNKKSKYWDLFDEIYAKFLMPSSDLPVNISDMSRSNVEMVVRKCRFFPASPHAMEVMFQAQRAARRVLYDVVFKPLFSKDKVYNKSKHQVETFDDELLRPDPNLDYWLNKEQDGFCRFKKFVAKTAAARDMLDFYTDCRALRETPTEHHFQEICVKYFSPNATQRVDESLALDVVQPIGQEYLITMGLVMRNVEEWGVEEQSSCC